jgi:hypothetical protein
MDVGGVDVLGISIFEKQRELERTLSNHLTELANIRRKLENPQVPPGKKEKLIYRQRVIQRIVIPWLRGRLEDIAVHI